jgi:hypothetical protein
MEFVPKDIQKRAIDFLNKQLFTTPTWLIDNQLTEKTGIDCYSSISRSQTRIIARLLNARTLNKMAANEQLNGSAKAYTTDEMFTDLKKSIWPDLQGGKKPDATKRLLQKAYVNALISLLDKPQSNQLSMNGMSAAPSEAPAIARGQLVDLRRQLTTAAASSTGIVRSHYLNLQALIDMAFRVK